LALSQSGECQVLGLCSPVSSTGFRPVLHPDQA
jgi:hypothetical protein